MTVTILPAIHIGDHKELFDRIIRITQSMFLACPRLFITAWYFELDKILLPTGRIWSYGTIGKCTDPIRVFQQCYAVRVLRSRFPFTFIEFDDLQ